MEEKKKRFRPTLTAYRELEAKVKELEAACVVTIDEYNDLINEKNTLEKSNQYMENELKLVRDKLSLMEEIADNRAAEVEFLKNRGFWDRVFNR